MKKNYLGLKKKTSKRKEFKRNITIEMRCKNDDSN